MLTFAVPAVPNMNVPLADGESIDQNIETYQESQALLETSGVKELILTHAIPVRSFAAGANPTLNLGIVSGGNFNMNDPEQNLQSYEWPLSRNIDDNFNGVQDWLHSDIRNLSMQFTLNTPSKINEISLD